MLGVILMSVGDHKGQIRVLDFLDLEVAGGYEPDTSAGN